ncbi:BOI-related E3 ubiquitin-protein ligase 1-like isoform X1 [Syzygium oleosum]|uniref:BOI-related E3 ubiquitin-protein ligase 1-like isoform X1 n=1 Tax=Syzygium oleosum TaxID=219896 RepID=UPI0011D23EDB|nr:BOI-related E3 ubiquitin-protein ligase 1-like isoform X1 [Syzygium oleosum]
MAMPQNLFQPLYQPQQQQQQQQQESSPFRNFYADDGRVPPLVALYGPGPAQDRPQHPPYAPPFNVVGVAPGTLPAADGNDGGADLQFNFGLEPKRRKLEEQDLFENNNSQVSSIDFLQARSVSTGLALSLDNSKLASSGDSALLSLLTDDIDRELQQQDAEIGRFLKFQADQLQKNILQKIQSSQLQSISFVEDQVLQKIREKEGEIESINKKNKELKEQMEQLTVEAGAWQQQARYSENIITTLKFNLQQIYAQSRDSKEGCGDSEVHDTASCCNARATDSQLLCNGANGIKQMICKVCRVNEVCMLLLPCKHLCLCRYCESNLQVCPVCQSPKFHGMEVYMS